VTMDPSRLQHTCQDSVAMDAATQMLFDTLEDQRETRDYPPAREKQSTGTQAGRPFRGEQKRRPAPGRGDSSTPESNLPSSSGLGYYLFQGGNGRTFQPYCWYRA
jgi:hypothetical protein